VRRATASALLYLAQRRAAAVRGDRHEISGSGAGASSARLRHFPQSSRHVQRTNTGYFTQGLFSVDGRRKRWELVSTTFAIRRVRQPIAPAWFTVCRMHTDPFFRGTGFKEPSFFENYARGSSAEILT